jgi:hypothetical protein
MDRDTWESQFAHLLQQKLQLTPEQVRFHWKMYYAQRYSTESAIADLEQKHKLYPNLRIFPSEEKVKNEV